MGRVEPCDVEHWPVELQPDPMVEWGTAIPSASQFPRDFVLGAATDAWWSDGTLDDAVSTYLTMRIPDFVDLGGEAATEEVNDQFALYRWGFTSSERSGDAEQGWLYLRLTDGGWGVVVATTDSIDASGLIHGSQGLQGTVASPASGYVLEAVQSSGTGDEEVVYEASLGPGMSTIDTMTGSEQIWLRVRHNDTGAPSITEFEMPVVSLEPGSFVIVDAAVTDTAMVEAYLSDDPRILRCARLAGPAATTAYQSSLQRDDRFVGLFEEAVEPVVYLLGEQEAIEYDELLADLRSIDGVLAAESLPAASYVEREPPPGSFLVIDSLFVDRPPVAQWCVAVGIETPPNQITTVDEPLVAATASAALQAVLDGHGDRPPQGSGYEEFVTPDGLRYFAWSEFVGLHTLVVRAEPVGNGYAITQWEQTGC